MNLPSTLLGYGKTDMVQPLLDGCNGRMATEQEILSNTTVPMAVAGITKRIIPNQARLHGLDWYSVDTGYFGNRASHKNWFRVTRNEYQLSSPIRARPSDRLNRLRLDLTHFRRGSRIVVVPTHPKVCAAWQLGDHAAWLRSTIDLIRKHTDRPVVVRERPASRHTRQYQDVFVDYIRDDVHAVVAWTSNCLVEAAMHGIPVVSLGASAAVQVSGTIEQIDQLPDLDHDQQQAWLRHLSYAQFTVKEMRTGVVWRLLHDG